MAHPSLFPLAPSAPRVRIAFLVLVGILLGLLFSGTGRAEADSVTTLSGDLYYPNGFTVPAGEIWELDPSADTTIESAGNVVVIGTLRMRPANESIDHTLTFVDVDESKFVGGGMMVLPNDIGLWVMAGGQLDIEGTAKTPWAYDWQTEWAGDEVLAAPVKSGDYEFTSVTGPSDVPSANTYGYQPELLNLTRNVVIGGTPEGRSHVFIHSQAVQTIKYATIQWVGPDFDAGTDQTGRYGLHFHHGMDGTRGSVVEGVVVRNAGNHAFVPHRSHGITFTQTISYDTVAAAYWWDPSTDSVDNSSDDITYDRVVAANASANPFKKHVNSAILLGQGENTSITGSVVVGYQGTGSNPAAYSWPGAEGGRWHFADNLAHNNKSNGIFVWQNTSYNHVVEDFVAYF
ncbi:MAG: hypothetical protein HKN91_02230, partial [Acidimicrobiia bacterium]|nr:hypothetical protein [Acidimicrobiia bacterium]